MLTIQTHLNTLCQSLESVMVRGGFLLSTGEVSNYWIPIDRLRNSHAINAIVEILRICLPNFQHDTNAQTVFVPKLTTTTSDTFPLDIIVGIVANQFLSNNITSSTKKPLNFYSIDFDRFGGVVSIPEGSPSGTWLGIFAISTHINLITSVLNELHRRERIVDNVLVIVERDKVTRQRLQQQGVNLIPLIICNEDTGKPTTILDMKQLPYIHYHKYFIGEP